ncbi:MAG: hypothetical protein ACFFDN_02375 [Candidatus Hodarchaeota archaeon]
MRRRIRILSSSRKVIGVILAMDERKKAYSEIGNRAIARELKLEIPNSCQCGFKNFYIWGTQIKGETHIEVRCMSCGIKNGIITR